MTKELDDFFHKQNTEIAIREFADELCGSDKQAAAFTASCSRFFELNSGGGLFFKMPSGEKVSAIRDPRVKEFFKSEYPFFMPPPKEAAAEFHGRTVEVDPAVVASALAGNLTAKGKVARAFGDDVSAADLFLKAEAKKASGGKGDDADNPHHDLSGTSGSKSLERRKLVDYEIRENWSKLLASKKPPRLPRPPVHSSARPNRQRWRDMSKQTYRTGTHDAPEPYTPKLETPGKIPANKVEIRDHLGRTRGMVGRKATAATVSRFIDGRDATLQKIDGRDVWVGKNPIGG